MSGALDNKETDHLNDGYGKRIKKGSIYNIETHRSDGSKRSDTDWI